MVTPDPDPTSRYPTAYCKTCGGGWPAYIRCERWETVPVDPNAPPEVIGGYSCKVLAAERRPCDFTGEVELTAEIKEIAELYARGEIPAGTRKLVGKSEWKVPTVDPNTGWGVPDTNDGWGVPTKGK